MTTTAVPAAAVAAAPEPPKSKLKLIVVLVLVLALGGGGAWYFLKGSSEEGAAPAPESGPVIDLEPMTLNLADGRYLKIGLSLEVTEEAAGGHGGEGVNGAKARDAAISILGQRTYQQMLSPKSRQAAVDALDEEITERYDGEVLHVYLTEFVMQ